VNKIVDPSSKYYPIRRGTRLPLEVPLLVTSLISTAKFSERCPTVVVNANVCGITAPRPLDLGTGVNSEIPTTKQKATTCVVDVIPPQARRLPAQDREIEAVEALT